MSKLVFQTLTVALIWLHKALVMWLWNQSLINPMFSRFHGTFLNGFNFPGKISGFSVQRPRTLFKVKWVNVSARLTFTHRPPGLKAGLLCAPLALSLSTPPIKWPPLYSEDPEAGRREPAAKAGSLSVPWCPQIPWNLNILIWIILSSHSLRPFPIFTHTICF